jgi:hypothetical protein
VTACFEYCLIPLLHNVGNVEVAFEKEKEGYCQFCSGVMEREAVRAAAEGDAVQGERRVAMFVLGVDVRGIEVRRSGRCKICEKMGFGRMQESRRCPRPL